MKKLVFVLFFILNVSLVIAEIPTWHIQYTGDINPQADVEYWNLDLFDNDASVMQNLKSQGTYVMCYFSAGSWENWRDDADDYPPECIGNPLEDWPTEKYFDIRCQEVWDGMAARMDLGISKGCDGFDPDNMGSYRHEGTGFSLTKQDEIDYFTFMADYAHARGKQIGLKNSLEMLNDVDHLADFAVNEVCYDWNECDDYDDFLADEKNVFQIQYGGEADANAYCNNSNLVGMATLIKNRLLDEPEISCLDWGSPVSDCYSDSDCDDGNSCTYDHCAEGNCINPVTPGVSCDDGIECTENDVCLIDGSCSSTILDDDLCIDNLNCLDRTCTQNGCEYSECRNPKRLYEGSEQNIPELSPTFSYSYLTFSDLFKVKEQIL